MARQMQTVAPDPELDAKLEAMEEAIERDLAARPVDEARVNFRWGREQLAFVKRAAAAMGIPYQTYIKQAVFRQAAVDLQLVQAVDRP
jgi:predicted DNA binding CopG/RHH family protein